MKRYLTSTTLILLIGCVAMAVVAFGQAGLGNDTTKSSSLSSADKHFVSETAEGGLAEVELGKLAQDKASSQEVKDFAQKMVEDHSKANDKLKETAQKVGASLPDHLSAMQLAEKTKLSAYSGEHFDRAYMSAMVKYHRQDVAAFRREAASGGNEEIKSFASKTLPTLEEHLLLPKRPTARWLGRRARPKARVNESAEGRSALPRDSPRTWTVARSLPRKLGTAYGSPRSRRGFIGLAKLNYRPHPHRGVWCPRTGTSVIELPSGITTVLGCQVQSPPRSYT